MRDPLPKLASVLALWIMLSAAVLHGQRGAVIGTIVHRNNTPAVNVLVSMAGKSRYTDVQGRYRLDGVPFGRYRMRIEKEGKLLGQADVDVQKPLTVLDQTIP